MRISLSMHIHMKLVYSETFDNQPKLEIKMFKRKNFPVTWNRHLTKTRLFQSLEIIHVCSSMHILGKSMLKLEIFGKNNTETVQTLQNNEKC